MQLHKLDDEEKEEDDNNNNNNNNNNIIIVIIITFVSSILRSKALFQARAAKQCFFTTGSSIQYDEQIQHK